jgi:uncharacterized protein YukE
MCGPIIIDLEAVRTLATDLASVADEFDSADADSAVIAAAVGHPGLSSTVTDTARGWNDKRGEISEGIRTLSDAATQVADGWADFDQQGADALTCE